MKFEVAKTIREIAQILGGKIVGNPEKTISAISRIEDAEGSDITFIADAKYLHFLTESAAGCYLVPTNLDVSEYFDKNFIMVEDSRKSLNYMLNMIASAHRQKFSSYIHPSASIGENCIIAKSAYIGANVSIGDNCVIEENVILRPGVVLYNFVKIGKNSTLHANSVCYDEIEIGENCIVHAGAVIGADGFGFEEQKDGSWIKIPQLGNVRIGDNVEIGANTAIDRALLGSTVVENGVKLDNLIHIAHNVTVGENTAMASQVGVAGSTKIGKRNRFGGQAGIAGHIETADDVILLARSGVGKSIPEKGFYFGAPARERMKAFKIEAVINNLPELKRDVDKLKKAER